MRYGLNLSAAGPAGDPRAMAELAREAEAAGWDAVLLEDYVVHHLAPDMPTYDPWVVLAAMAAATERLLIGTDVTPVSRRRPWKLARECVTLDHLSNGRVILGVGLGDLKDHGFGEVGEVTDLKARAEMLDEALEIIAGLWTGEPFSFEGRHYRLAEVQFRPRPVQRPRIPIWVGGQLRPAAIRRAARWDGALLGWKSFEPGRETGPADLCDLVERVRRARGGDLAGYDFVMGARTRLADEGAERDSLAGLAEAGATWWTEWIRPGPLEEVRSAVRRGPVRV